MARADSLSEAAKEVLQIGSVIESEFTYELMRAVTGIPEEALVSYLSSLRDAELVYERGVFPKCTYVLKHALVRDVICDSILTKKKEILHEAIGNAMEVFTKCRADGWVKKCRTELATFS